MNGEIDVTLPADIKANLKMKVDNGDMYTDFDVKLTNDTFETAESKTEEGRPDSREQDDLRAPSTAAVQRCSSPHSTVES